MRTARSASFAQLQRLSFRDRQSKRQVAYQMRERMPAGEAAGCAPKRAFTALSPKPFALAVLTVKVTFHLPYRLNAGEVKNEMANSSVHLLPV